MEAQARVVETELKQSVAIIRLSSEETRNALSNDMREQLAEAIMDAGRDRDVRAIYLTGRGPNFCAGGDLKTFKTMHSDPWAVHRRFRDMGRWLLPLMRIEKPVVVGVRGYAVGGGFGIALAGDMIFASDTAKFMASWMRLGLLPDALTLYTLPRLIGLARARRMFIANETLTAKAAQELGLVTEVFADDELDERAFEFARTLAEGPAEVWGLAKMILARTFETSMDDMFLLEGLGQIPAMGGPEFSERLSATLEKRPLKPSVGDLLNR